MKVEHVVVTLVLLIISSKSTFQQFAGCRESFFSHKGACTPCPDRCATCISDLNCTKCYTNYYGPVCQYTCPRDCDDPCHKEHGYCTYGCADGRFPDPNSSLCLKCPAQCKTCKSMTECFECIPGYYGNKCETQCSSDCVTCNKTAGSCLVCHEGYFNQNGQCRRCPDGCLNCYDGKSCSSCQDGYLELTGGQCIMECPIASNTGMLDQTWYSSEDMMLQGCMEITKGQLFVVKTRKPCMQNTTCSPNILCPPEDEGKSSTCGTIKTYQCSHSCRQLNESFCRCEPNCKIIEDSLLSMVFCFTNEQAFSDIKLSTESECPNFSEGSHNATAKLRAVRIVVLISVIVLVVVFVSLVLIRLRKSQKRNRKRQREDVVDATVITLHSEENLETYETSCLKGSNSNDATMDTVKTEEKPILFSNNVESISIDAKSSEVKEDPYTIEIPPVWVEAEADAGQLEDLPL